MYPCSSVRDGLSLSLGVVSVVSWTIAEIPQVMTNYNQKSTEGISIAFLTTWMLGDIFNLLGCLMEPATLPTQFYMALVYTVATAILYVQSIYYRHIYPRLKNRRNQRQRLEDPLLSEDATRPSTKSVLCVVSMFLFLGTFSLSNLLSESKTMGLGQRDRALVVRGARKLLQVTSGNLRENNGEMGMLLGWAMAAIYMGGRFPQIRLNMRSGHVDGLNPLMFLFAVVGNITYVASILVISIEWLKIAPNLPWLVDAGACALLDFLILLQIFHCKRKDSDEKKRETGEILV